MHDAIRSSLASFAAEARSLEVALSPGGALGGRQLGSLLERHRFLRAMCSCHSASETDVLFPAARALCRGTGASMQVPPTRTCHCAHPLPLAVAASCEVIEDIPRHLAGTSLHLCALRSRTMTSTKRKPPFSTTWAGCWPR